MSGVETLDAAWRRAHPLPAPDDAAEKNGRGRVLSVGGSRRVPGAIRLTAEAALRVGAGKSRVATVESAALALGIGFPEIAVVALAEDAGGDIAADELGALFAEMDRTDAAVVGPGTIDRAAAARLVARVAAEPRPAVSLVLDAAAVACAGPLRDQLAGYAGRLVLTPHHGEMCDLTGGQADAVARDPAAAARDAAARFGAVVVLKAASTVVAAPDGRAVRHPGGCVGLATGGSGDVLAGAVGGLLAWGADPFTAAAWAVWLHGEAGHVLARARGPVGFLARELLPVLPTLLPR